jgi:hypothetical protein
MAAGLIPSSLQRQQLESGIKHEANQTYGIPYAFQIEQDIDRCIMTLAPQYIEVKSLEHLE